MDIQTNQSISDDQELAKALAGVTQDMGTNLQFEETAAATPPVNSAPITPDPATPADAATTVEPALPEPTIPQIDPVVPAVEPPATTDPTLDNIKQTALNELRPLIGKLNVSPEEKFDTYLLLLRSTDDKELIAPAHDAAVAIVDEARRAQALLDIIKEIDYLASPQQN